MKREKIVNEQQSTVLPFGKQIIIIIISVSIFCILSTMVTSFPNKLRGVICCCIHENTSEYNVEETHYKHHSTNCCLITFTCTLMRSFPRFW